MGCIADGNRFRPVRREHTEQSAATDTQIAQDVRIPKNQSEQGLAREALIAITKNCGAPGAPQLSKQFCYIYVIFDCHRRAPEKRGVIAPVFVLPVGAFDVKLSCSEPTPSTAAEVKATAEGASLRPEGLDA
jgi:hypothetical protein